MPDNMLKFLQQPGITALRYLQMGLALIIFFYAAWASMGSEAGYIPPTALHFLGNILLLGSIWLALLFRLPLLAIAAISFGFSACAEAGQLFTHNRFANGFDLAINIAGLLVGYGICLFFEHLFKLKICNKK